MHTAIDLLSRPVYGMAQVDWILRLTPGTARRWIDGYDRGGKHYDPIVRVDTTGDEIVTWGEFTETRLLSEFRDGVPMVHMRPAVKRLRELFGRPYPLAHALPWLETEGRELVLRVQEEVGLDAHFQLIVLRNDQLMLTLPTDRFVRSMEWDDSGVARRMHPLPELDRVVLDPLRQFGEPVVRSVPTAVIAEQVRAGDRIAMIADLYELSEDDVEQAIRYELLRGREAPQAA